MLDYQLDRESSLTLAMKLLYNLFDSDEVIDNALFYWNGLGTEDDMPNFWLKEHGVEVEWYRDDPGRAASSTHESTAELAFFILDVVRYAHAVESRGETQKS